MAHMKSKRSAIILIILTAVVFCCGCTGTDALPVAQDGVQENTVGVLMPLSGDYAEVGESGRVALEVAVVVSTTTLPLSGRTTVYDG